MARMAQITLQPNESFEHTHSKDTYTRLQEGEGVLKMGGKEIKMVKGKKYKIPAGQSHTVMNNSSKVCGVWCMGY